MNTAEAADAGQILGASSDVLDVIAAFAGGLIVVALLICPSGVDPGVRPRSCRDPL